MVEMTHYTITAERSDKWWVLQALEAPGAISQVARLDQADIIKEAIAFVTGTPESDIDITVQPVLPGSVSVRMETAERLREEAQAANSKSAAEIRAAAKELKAAGLTLRDIGTVMDVSYQRAHQLVNS
jgi:hypothetical protein